MEQEFYFLREKDGFAEAISKETPFERRICKECGGIKVIHLENERVSFKKTRKGNYYSISPHFLIDAKLKSLLQENNITGYEVKDIELVGSDAFREDGIQEMVITGRAGHLQKLSGEEFGTCSTCGKIQESKKGNVGVSFDLDKWDGSDIFLIDNFYGIPVVTQKVKDLLVKNKIKNVSFENLKEKTFIFD